MSSLVESVTSDTVSALTSLLPSSLSAHFSSLSEILLFIPQRLLHAAQLSLLLSWQELVHFGQEHSIFIPLLFSLNLLIFGAFPQVSLQLNSWLVVALKELLYIALWPFSWTFLWIRRNVFSYSASSSNPAQRAALPPSSDLKFCRPGRDPLYNFRTDFDSDDEDY